MYLGPDPKKNDPEIDKLNFWSTLIGPVNQLFCESFFNSIFNPNEQSSSEEEEEEPDEEDVIKPLPEDAKRKRKKAAEVMKRPSFQKQTSRYTYVLPTYD